MKTVNSKSSMVSLSTFSTGGFIAKYGTYGHMNGNCTGELVTLKNPTEIKEYLMTKGYDYKGSINGQKKSKKKVEIEVNEKW